MSLVERPPFPFTTIGYREQSATTPLFASRGNAPPLPLSGYIAGKRRGGYFVQALENSWAEKFHVKHAVAVNSATSGLLAAAFAAGLRQDDQFICPAMTMSATAAAPMFTGADPWFWDINNEDFGVAVKLAPISRVRAAFITNLFGHPAGLTEWRYIADRENFCLIEDCAQSPFAVENGKFAGTIGHIGVFSLNIHKPLQAGEGGIIVTDDDALATELRDFINHGENLGGEIGLNLRMAELVAAVALSQLNRAPDIIGGRTEQAHAIIDAIGEIPGLRPPVTREACSHVFYTIPFLIDKNRVAFCANLRDQGVPVVEGYVPPLYRLPAFRAFAQNCPTAEDLHDHRLFYIENCAWSFTSKQARQVGEAFRKAAEKTL